MSAALKEEGNRKFKEGDFSGAVEAYSQSLEHDPEQHLCYSNRSAAYLKLGMFEKALLDAESCTKMAPEFPKGYSRQAAALQELKRWEEAFAILEQGTTKCSQDDAAALQKTSHEAKDRWLICQLQGCWHGKVTEALGGYEQEIEFLNSREVRVQVLGRSIMGRFWVDASQSPMHLDIQVVMEDIPVTMPPPPPVPYITKVDDEGLHLCCPYMKLERPETFGGEGYCKMAKGTLDNSQDASVQQLSKAEQLLLCAKEVIKALPSERPPEIDAMDNEEAQQQKVMAQVKFETAIFKVQNRFGEELMKEVFEAAKGEAPEGLRGTAELEELRSKLQIIESTPEPEPDPVAERAARRARRKAPVPEAEGISALCWLSLFTAAAAAIAGGSYVAYRLRR